MANAYAKLQKCFVDNGIPFIWISINCFSWTESVPANFLNVNLTMNSSKRWKNVKEVHVKEAKVLDELLKCLSTKVLR